MHDRVVGMRVITQESLRKFWIDNENLSERHGVYVFALQRRGPGAPVPFYVGKTEKGRGFKQETFNPRNRRAYNAALLVGHGTPLIYFLALRRSRGPRARRAIDNLETLLIWIARHRNPNLVNRRKQNTTPWKLMSFFDTSKVLGVLNAGRRPSAAARELRRVLGARAAGR